MARGRMISGTIGESRKFAALANDTHRLIYLMVMPHVDKAGRYEADPILIKGRCLTRLDIDVSTVEAWLEDAANVGLIRHYEARGMTVLEIVNFTEHNTPHHKEPDSKLPGPEEGTPCSTLKSNVDPSMSQERPKHEPTLPIIKENKREVKEREEMSTASVDDSQESSHPPPLDFDRLAEIWNRESGNLRKVRDLEAAKNNPELQRLAKAFLKRHGSRAEEIFTAGIAAVTTDPHWLGRRATPVKRQGAPYGLLNYLRHVEDKAEIAAELQATSSGPTVGMPRMPARPWEAYDIAQHHTTGEVATIHELLADGQARMSNGETWNLSECDRCNN